MEVAYKAFCLKEHQDKMDGAADIDNQLNISPEMVRRGYKGEPIGRVDCCACDKFGGPPLGFTPCPCACHKPWHSKGPRQVPAPQEQGSDGWDRYMVFLTRAFIVYCWVLVICYAVHV